MRGAALALGLLLAGGGAARAAPPACLAEASLESERAFVGQQVVYRLRILRRPEVGAVRWEQPLAFPSFRSEWLPGRRPDPAIGDVGEGSLVYEERRALFPARAGRLVIPAARLRCAVGEGGALREVAATISELTMEVDPLPEAGRPPDAGDVVGPLRIEAAVAPARIALGESARLSIHLIGQGNPWVAAAPVHVEAALPDVDVFPHPPELQLDPGERLRARRSFRYDLVPRRPGRVEIPAPEVVYFDPAARRYARAAADALRLEVEPARPPSAAAPPTAAPDAPEPSTPGEPVTRIPWRAALLAAGLAVAAAIGWRRVRGRGDPVAERLAEADRAEARGDVEAARAALDRALREALAPRVPGAREAAPERLERRAPPELVEWVRLLARLERARFGGATDAPGAAAVRSALGR